MKNKTKLTEQKARAKTKNKAKQNKNNKQQTKKTNKNKDRFIRGCNKRDTTCVTIVLYGSALFLISKD